MASRRVMTPGRGPSKVRAVMISVAVCLVGHGARSETAGQGAAASAGRVAGETADALQEIIVTAQRRSEDVQHAALGIDVISAQALSVAGVARATDLASLVPALQVSESGNSQQSLYLRSVGTLSATAYTDPAIAFNVDGVAIGRPSSMTAVFFDLQRAEVLKGPQGTLYGRNATGGAINIIPNQPQLGDTFGEAALTVGNYGEVHPEVMGNLGLTDSSAARLAFTYTRHDGYQTDGTGDANSVAGRVQYLYRPNDSLSIRFAADYAHEGGHNGPGTVLAIQNPFTGSLSASPLPRDVGNSDPRIGAILSNQYSFIAGRFFVPIQGEPRTDNDFAGVLGEIIWHTPVGSLTVLPSYRHAKLSDFSTLFIDEETAQERDQQSSLEVRFASDDAGLARWLLGGYYFHETIDAVYQFDQQALAPIQDLTTSTLSRAAFGRITVAPLQDFRISAGVRYTDDRKGFDGNSQILLSACAAPATPVPACPNAPLIPPATQFAAIASQLQLFPIIPNALYGSTLPGAGNSVFPLINKSINERQEFTKVTYHAGLEYDLSKDSLIYANWDTGYHAGGFAFADIKPSYLPEYVSAYSVGSKNRFRQDTLQINVEGFYWRYTNQQISHGGLDTDGAYVFYTDNAGSSVIKGGELSVKYLVAPHTTLNLDAQYLSAIYNRFTYQTPAGGTNGPPLTGCPFGLTDPSHYTVNCAGQTAQQAPRWSGTVGVRQSVDIGDYSLVGDVNLRGQTSTLVGFEMIPLETQKSYGEIDLAISLLPKNSVWSVVAFVNNLTDQRPYGIAYYNSVTSIIGASVGPPRTEGVRASIRF
jgi:iron complex outermembrane receptor protein